jgi:uncharacterized surface protein with fasciclin (FAS1) repeats
MKTRFLALTMGALMITGAAQAAQPAAAPAAPAAAAPAPLAPPVAAKSDTMETLTLDGRFKILVKGLDDTNLSSLVKATPNLTIFAPTDAAFNALPADQLAKAQADKATMQQLLLLHMINAPVDSSKIKGAKGPLPTVGGKKVLLDGSEDTVMKVGGADIVQADVKPAKGLIQVVDHILVEDTSPPTPAQ